jgi:hypothetical protein
LARIQTGKEIVKEDLGRRRMAPKRKGFFEMPVDLKSNL